MRKFLIAATNSGCGKTTITIGLLRALQRKGLRVQPFKCGPDYIDTQYHRIAAGVESVNLDTWFAEPAHLREVFHHYGQEADVCVVEGVMGAYDGYDRWHGSSAEIAEILNIPMILIVNAKSMAYSVAPILYGFKKFNEIIRGEKIRENIRGENIRGENIRGERIVLSASDQEQGIGSGKQEQSIGSSEQEQGIGSGKQEQGIGSSDQEQGTVASDLAENYSLTSNNLTSNLLNTHTLSGVIFNNVGSERHARLLREACEDVGVACFGMIPRLPNLMIPSRHLGLTLENQQMIETLVENAADAVSQYVDVEGIFREEIIRGEKIRGENILSINISIAHDEAFNFTYRENIDRLRTLGKVTFFSPLRDKRIPEGTELLYLPGGYPEFFLKELSANKEMRASVHDYIEKGGKTLAECGGMMYLCKQIIDPEGVTFPMCGILKQEATLQDMHLHLGYREMMLNGLTWRGHEFHYSEVRGEGAGVRGHENAKVCDATGHPTETPFYIYKNLRASYLHLYWGDRNILSLFE